MNIPKETERKIFNSIRNFPQYEEEHIDDESLVIIDELVKEFGFDIAPYLVHIFRNHKNWLFRVKAKNALGYVAFAAEFYDVEEFIKIIENEPTKPVDGSDNKQSTFVRSVRCFKTGELICPKKITEKEKQVFVAMPFKKKFFEVYDKAIKPCLISQGFSPIKSDDEFVSIDLMCHICELIRESKYAIVNISDWNANVMFELGLIWGMSKEAILLKDEKSKIPADLSGMFYVPYEFGFHDKLKDELGKRVDSIFK